MYFQLARTKAPELIITITWWYLSSNGRDEPLIGGRVVHVEFVDDALISAAEDDDEVFDGDGSMAVTRTRCRARRRRRPLPLEYRRRHDEASRA